MNSKEMFKVLKSSAKNKSLSSKTFDKFCEDHNLEPEVADELYEKLMTAGIDIVCPDMSLDENSSDSSVQFYYRFMKENGYERLLTKEEEQALGQRIAQGDPDAKEELANFNYRLVISIASAYQNRGVSLDDLIQEGVQGLWKAVDKYDFTRGLKFSTYAVHWIRQAVTRSIADQGRTIRIPVHLVEKVNKLKRIQSQLISELDREPTVDELSEATGFDKDQIEFMFKVSQDPLSLDKPVGEDGDSSLGEFIEADQNDIDISEERILLGETVNARVDKLCTPREAFVLKYRFGIIDGIEHTLEETAAQILSTPKQCKTGEIKILKDILKQNLLNKNEETVYRLRFGLTCDLNSKKPDFGTLVDMSAPEISEKLHIPLVTVQEYLKSAIQKINDTELSPWYRRVFELRSGLNKDGIEYNIVDTAKRTHVTRERVRQIESKGISRLRFDRTLNDWRDNRDPDPRLTI